MLLSILHRITGMALAFGLLALAYWLVAVASGGEAYERAVTLLTGRGFEKSQATASAWFVLMFALAATAIYWVLL